VTTPLVVVATVLAVTVALLGALSTLLRRRIGQAHLVGAAALEVVLVVQAVVAVVALAEGHRPVEMTTFLAYLSTVVLLPVGGVLWARSEPTRWAGTVLGVAAVAVAVMIWRLLQLWEVTGG
jgi:crotonobetainyl-CoA:carnitine CoA-transferase CaiB-like acyl-CoA transferase